MNWLSKRQRMKPYTNRLVVITDTSAPDASSSGSISTEAITQPISAQTASRNHQFSGIAATSRPAQRSLPMAKQKQGHFEEMAPPSISELDDAAESYVDVRNKRMKLTTKEIEAHGQLLEIMKKHKLTHYEYDGFEVNISRLMNARARRGSACAHLGSVGLRARDRRGCSTPPWRGTPCRETPCLRVTRWRLRNRAVRSRPEP
jgi:hypothetical protein